MIHNSPAIMNIRTFVTILSRNPQHDFPKMRGGGSNAVWNLSENSSVLVSPSVPNPLKEPNLSMLLVTRGAESTQVKRLLVWLNQENLEILRRQIFYELLSIAKV